MIVELILLLLGVYLILKGSEWLTDAAAPVARSLNTTNVAVGLILVSFLLSLPELLVSLSLLRIDHVQIAIGVSIGSIIVNLGLIIGASAFIRPLRIPKHVITRDAVFMVVITIVVTLIALEDLQLTRRDGIILLLLFIPYLINVYEQEKMLATREKIRESEMLAKTLELVGKLGNVDLIIKNEKLIFILGAVMLIAGSELFTGGLVFLTKVLALPEILIGITIGALGPSIPNIAAAFQARKKGYDELAVSETIGSNIFTLLITLGIIAMVNPFVIDSLTIQVTVPALLAITGVFFIFTLTGTISRFAGFVLLAIYILTMIAEVMVRI